MRVALSSSMPRTGPTKHGDERSTAERHAMLALSRVMTGEHELDTELIRPGTVSPGRILA